MAHANENFANLQAGYLFPEVAKRIRAWSERNPGEKVLRLSIGNTTEAIPPSVAKAMKDKIDALSNRDTRGFCCECTRKGLLETRCEAGESLPGDHTQKSRCHWSGQERSFWNSSLRYH